MSAMTITYTVVGYKKAVQWQLQYGVCKTCAIIDNIDITYEKYLS